MTSPFYRLQVKGLHREFEDLFTCFCFDHGAQGVSENLPYTQPELRYDPILDPSAEAHLDVFFSERPSEEFLLQLAAEFPQTQVFLAVEEQKDWLEEWKKGFEPFCFVDPFWIVPSWCESPPEARQPLFIEPGMAFGTGTHETTRLAAQLVQKVFSLRSVDSVLDVGMGTGILAMMAAKLEAPNIVALDIDPECRRVARENMQKNAVESVQVEDHLLADETGSYDLVIANIIDGVLLELKADLLRVLRPGGSMVLSGILTDRESHFCNDFLQGSGLVITERRQMGEWVALLLTSGT